MIGRGWSGALLKWRNGLVAIVAQAPSSKKMVALNLTPGIGTVNNNRMTIKRQIWTKINAPEAKPLGRTSSIEVAQVLLKIHLTSCANILVVPW